MTEESNSAIFKLTPIASQNVTQKTNMLGHLNNHGEKTTESNNLNYSYSECESEWAAAALPRDNNAVSPMSVNTTSSKIKLPGNKLSRMNHNKILF